MSRWWWVRHGPTHARGFAGWTDLPADLSDITRINRLALSLPSDALVVSSDLVRATATADALADGRPRLPATKALREIHFGEWEGLTFSQIEARDPETARAFWTEPGDVAPPGGESWNRMEARVSAFVDDVTRAHPGRDVLAVAHLGVILSQYRRARGVSAQEVLGKQLEPLSLSRFDLGPDGWEMVAINLTP
ncbi:MAG: histidine phosphatase family protein [Rhodobacteraceae bacterium]|nr:histidine phosphatase family protein [Paracoccaceae bacterium]